MRCLPLVLVAFALGAAPAAQAADSLVAPTALALNAPVSENTAGFTVEAGEQNTAAPFHQQCDSGHNVGGARPAGPSQATRPAALPVLRPTVSTTVVFGRRFTRFSKLNVSGAGAGATIFVGCSSKKGGCPFKTRALAVKSSKPIGLASLLKN